MSDENCPKLITNAPCPNCGADIHNPVGDSVVQIYECGTAEAYIHGDPDDGIAIKLSDDCRATAEPCSTSDCPRLARLRSQLAQVTAERDALQRENDIKFAMLGDVAAAKEQDGWSYVLDKVDKALAGHGPQALAERNEP